MIEIVKMYLLGLNDSALSSSTIDDNLNKLEDYIYNMAQNEAKNEKCIAISKEIVFGWARHYFDEKLYEKDEINIEHKSKEKKVSKKDNKDNKDYDSIALF